MLDFCELPVDFSTFLLDNKEYVTDDADEIVIALLGPVDLHLESFNELLHDFGDGGRLESLIVEVLFHESVQIRHQCCLTKFVILFF